MSDEANPIQKLATDLALIEDCNVHLRPPKYPDGFWWVDAWLPTGSVAVEWRQDGKGFGISDMSREDIGYGEGPDEVITDEAEMRKRVGDIILGIRRAP